MGFFDFFKKEDDDDKRFDLRYEVSFSDLKMYERRFKNGDMPEESFLSVKKRLESEIKEIEETDPDQILQFNNQEKKRIKVNDDKLITYETDLKKTMISYMIPFTGNAYSEHKNGKVFREIEFEYGFAIPISPNSNRVSKVWDEDGKEIISEEIKQSSLNENDSELITNMKEALKNAKKLGMDQSTIYRLNALIKSESDDHHGTISDFKKAIDLDPNDPDNVMAYTSMALHRCELKDYEGAVKDLTKAIIIDPKNSELYRKRGNAFARSKDFLNILRAQHSIKIDNNADYNSALIDFTKAIELNPNDHISYLNRGVVKKKLKDDKGGSSDFEKYLEIELLSSLNDLTESQDINRKNMVYLDENGITIKASKEAVVGEEYELNGEQYKVVDEKMLREMIKNGEDITKVVTSRITNMAEMSFSESFNQNISSWDVSEVTDMFRLFLDAKEFNQDISNWNVSKVENMRGMFADATIFDQDIGNWDVSKVRNFAGMFTNAKSFNGNVSTWDLKSATNIGGMFHFAKSFNQDISNWDVSKVENMMAIFSEANSFNQDIGSWDVSKVENMRAMFYKASSFNQDISNWNVSEVTDMSWMFAETNSFNQDISSWDLSRVTTLQKMFFVASKFNQDIGFWDISKVTNLVAMFEGAPLFNQDISSWDVSEVIDMSWMFNGASSFNQDISSWDVSRVTNMQGMFSLTSFNQDIGKWNVSNVTNMREMFAGDTIMRIDAISLEIGSFNQDISSWDVSNVTDMRGMFGHAKSFNQDISSWDVSNVIDMGIMFKWTPFNQDIGKWDVSNVNNMAGMFEHSSSFNQDISNWNVSKVTDMFYLFKGAKMFNQNIDSWNVSNVTDMESMFDGASSFNQDISNWDVNEERINELLKNSPESIQKSFKNLFDGSYDKSSKNEAQKSELNSDLINVNVLIKLLEDQPETVKIKSWMLDEPHGEYQLADDDATAQEDNNEDQEDDFTGVEHFFGSFQSIPRDPKKELLHGSIACWCEIIINNNEFLDLLIEFVEDEDWELEDKTSPRFDEFIEWMDENDQWDDSRVPDGFMDSWLCSEVIDHGVGTEFGKKDIAHEIWDTGGNLDGFGINIYVDDEDQPKWSWKM